MKFKEFLLESEMLNEMATCYSDNETSIRVNPVDSGNLVYFKYCNTQGYNSSTAIARISLLNAEYINNHNDGHTVLVLSNKAKKKLNDKLSEQSKKYVGYTVFQAIIIDYNIEKFGIYLDDTKKIMKYEHNKPLPLNLTQPDYRNLPSEDTVIKKLKSKRVITI